MDRKSGILFAAMTLALLGGTAACAGDRADLSPLTQALDRLTATEEALDRTRLRYQEILGHQDLDVTEAEDYRGFIVALDRQLHTVCEEVRRLGGNLSAHGAYCAASGDRGDAALPGTARTRAEIAAGIDHELDAAVSEFDEMLLREQQVLDQHAQSSNQSNGSSGGGGGTGSPNDAGDGDEADGQEPGAGGGGEARPAVGSVGRGATGAVTEDGIPDGRDDDVVARQLREAAMSEQDPELRRRLWEEYKRYKQGGSSNR